ncbi:MAG TPA: NAD(P)-dependent alcohol dehydrogenase [Steroidobacteraceae bacterium]|nr:NAD(P)-dependent alcohol dehydrogenase [Steroidobacteraceae bacterium]
MQAAVSRSGAAVPELESIDIGPPQAGEVLVRMVASGICHTDLRVHAGRGPGTLQPIVLGHEGAGIVEELGAGVVGLAPGDPVVLSGSSCGRCASCRSNHPSYCDEMLPRNFGGLRMDGTSALTANGQRLYGHFFGQSSFAQYCIASERTAVKVPREVPLRLLGPLGCGVITGVGAVLYAMKVQPGDTIAIFGTGGVGLSAVMAARLAGACRIIAIDIAPQRLALARELGATDVLDARPGDAGKAVRDLTGRGVDFSFNTTPAPGVFTQALECLATRGTAVFVTAPQGDWKPAMFPMLAGGRRLQGIVGGEAAPQLAIPMLIEYYRQGRLPFDRLLRFYPFEQIAAAFRDMEHGIAIKPVLEIGSGELRS